MENELIKYIEKNPEVELMKGLTNTNKWYVRPMNWCGCWKSDKLVGGRCLAYFDTKEEYSINEVAFAGPQVYLQGLIKRLQEHELKTYSTNTINYTIL